MAKRRKLKSVKQEVRATSLHDRIVTDIPEHARVIIVDIEDPYHDPNAGLDRKFTTGLANLRGDPLRDLYSRNKIDYAQYVAGRKFQGLLERATVGSIRGFELTEFVDGGSFSAEILNDARRQAVKKLEACKAVLGTYPYLLMTKFLSHCEESMSINLSGLFHQVDHSLEKLAKHFRDA